MHLIKFLLSFCFLFAGLAEATSRPVGPALPPSQIKAPEAPKTDGERFQELVRYFQAEPYYAGVRLVTCWAGFCKVIDRTAEPVDYAIKKPVGQPPQMPTKLTDLIGGIKSQAKGELSITYTATYYEDGTLKSETWSIQGTAAWGAQAGMDEATDKQHK